MKLFYTLLLSLFWIFIFNNTVLADIQKDKIAVLPFELQGNSFETDDLGRIVSEWLITAFVQNGRFEVIERSLLGQVMEEQQMVGAGIATQETAMEVGRILGVKVVVSGTITNYRGMLDINARIIDVGSASIVTAENVRCRNMDQLQELLFAMADKIMKDFPLQGYIAKREQGTVFIDMGKQSGIRPGMTFMSYKEGAAVKHPKTQKVLYVEEIKTGTLQITEVRQNISIATIIEEAVSLPIESGNLVRSLKERPKTEPLPAKEKKPAMGFSGTYQSASMPQQYHQFRSDGTVTFYEGEGNAIGIGRYVKNDNSIEWSIPWNTGSKTTWKGVFDGLSLKVTYFHSRDNSTGSDILNDVLQVKARQIVQDLFAENSSTKVYVQPIRQENHKYVSDFSHSFTDMVKNALREKLPSGGLVDSEPAAAKFSNVRGIKNKARNNKQLSTSDAFFADADSLVEGSYRENETEVTVSLSLKDIEGKVLGSADATISKQYIAAKLKNDTAEKLADLADKATELGDSFVKISTSKGSGSPVYRNGENITFFIQVARPLYVYIYDIDTNSNVSLLYPYTTEGPLQVLSPGNLYTIPDENDDFEMTVEPPFGMDAVKVFASPVQLPIPRMSSQVAAQSYVRGTRAIKKARKKVQKDLAGRRSINPSDLVDYYRGLADRFKTELYEDSLILETRL